MANRSRSRPGYSRPHLSSLYLLLTIPSPFPVRYSPFRLASVSLSNSPTPDEELAERRWRSDACEASVSACRRLSICPNPGQARLAFIAHHGRPRPAIDFRKPGKPDLRRGALRSQRRDARLFGAPPWRFSARARARRCPAFPPGSCGDLVRRTGHRYPEERVSRTSPARPLTASRDATASLRLTGSPLEAPLMSEDAAYIA
jgi:hypothetical protein